MARVKRGVTAGRRHKKVLGKAKGYYNARRKIYRAAKQAVIKAGPVRVPRPARQEARVPRAVDHAHQRRGARARAVLQPPDRGPAQGGHRNRPQGAGGSGGPRRQRLRRDRRAGQGRAARPERLTWASLGELDADCAARWRRSAPCEQLAALDETARALAGQEGRAHRAAEGARCACQAAERPAAGARINDRQGASCRQAIEARRAAARTGGGRAASWPPAASTSRCPDAARPPAACIRSRGRGCASRRSSAAPASRSPRARRSRMNSTTSKR